jgi:hypothetical protein
MSEPIYQIWVRDDYPSHWEDVPFDEYQRVKDPDDKRVLYEHSDFQSQIGAKDNEIATLKESLSKFQTSEFNPDWSLLQASQESLLVHMTTIRELQSKNTDLLIALAAERADHALTENQLQSKIDDLAAKVQQQNEYYGLLDECARENSKLAVEISALRKNG